MSPLTRLFICCDSDSFLLGTDRTMSNTDNNSTERLLQELLAKVNTLTEDVNVLEAKDGGRTYPQKCRHDGGSGGNTGHDGDNTIDRDGDLSDEENIEEVGSDGSHTTRFPLSEGGEAFLEATFDSRLDYKGRKAQIPKYSEPYCNWTTCPNISLVVAATLPNTSIKDNKLASRTQEMYMEAVAPLTALLENADDESFTLKEAIPMIQLAIQLLGDVAQHHSSQRRKAIIQHLNPQLQTLMKDEDFKESQPLLFGEDFGEKAKARIEVAAALKKVVNPLGDKGKHKGFQKSHPQRNSWGHQGGKPKYYGPASKPNKEAGTKTTQGKS